MDDSAGNAGGGAGKVTFGDLLIQKPSDGCTLPLFILAAKGLSIKRIVLNELSKNNKSVLTLTLQNVIIASSRIKGAEVSQNAREMLDLSYADLTIADASGNVMGRILR